MPENERFYPLESMRKESVQLLYQETVTAIGVLAGTYIVGITLFALSFPTPYYCFAAVMIPLLGYWWLTTFGSKHVNHYYGFQKTSAGICIYVKQHQKYSTHLIIHVFIFLIGSAVRLVCEIHNLLLIRQFAKESTGR